MKELINLMALENKIRGALTIFKNQGKDILDLETQYVWLKFYSLSNNTLCDYYTDHYDNELYDPCTIGQFHLYSVAMMEINNHNVTGHIHLSLYSNAKIEFEILTNLESNHAPNSGLLGLISGRLSGTLDMSTDSIKKDNQKENFFSYFKSLLHALGRLTGSDRPLLHIDEIKAELEKWNRILEKK